MKLKYFKWAALTAAFLCFFTRGVESAPAAIAANDNLNAVLWTQTSAEYKGNARGMYRLAEVMLDRALSDKAWTAVPSEQGAAFEGKPPAVILDVDETVLDNSAYAAWLVSTGGRYSSKTWVPFVRAERSGAIPGALEFVRYAREKGVTVFYVTNRKAPQEEATRNNLKKLGFELDADQDTVLMRGEKEDWGSAKGTRKAFIAARYRVLLVGGDNFGDFVDDSGGTPAQRAAVWKRYEDYWGTRWIVVANPTYGSWESAAFAGDYKLPEEKKRALKIGAMTPWDAL